MWLIWDGISDLFAKTLMIDLLQITILQKLNVNKYDCFKCFPQNYCTKKCVSLKV